MSRYVLLFLVNLPFALAAIIGAVTQYKLKRSSKSRMYIRIIVWILIMTGLAAAQPIYQWLFNSKLTHTEPMTLFDVIEITGIVVTFYVANRTRAKLEVIERRLNDLHQELSIRLSARESHESE